MNKPVDPAAAGLAAAASARGSGPAREAGPSMRSWLETLEANNQLRRIDVPVDWDEEIGAIARVNIAVQGPGLFFRNIRDYRSTTSTKFVTCGISNKAQVRLMLGLPDDADDKATVRHLKDAYRNPIRPVTVDHGPCKENILTGDAIDLEQFPAPRWHAADGGKFIDTFCGVITHDPATDRPNIGLYRGQVLGPAKIGKLLVPTQGWGDHFLKYRDAKGRMPVAIAYGWHDVMPFCAGSPFPKHVCEWDMMGAILGRPVELIDCETVPLQVPATSEIVVEGWIDPDPSTWEMEGPFADYPGYLGGKPSPKPVVEVSCVSHRNDPIMRGALEGARPGLPSEDSLLCAYSWSAIAWNMLEDAGVSGIADVWMPPVVTGANIVVQVRKQYRGHAQQIGMALMGHQRRPVVLQECHGRGGGYRYPRPRGAGMGLRLPGQCRARRCLAGRADLRLGARSLDPARRPGRQGLRHRQMDPHPDRRDPELGASAEPGLGRQPLAAGQHHRSGPGTEDRRPLARLRHRRALSRRCKARATDARRNPQGAERFVGAHPSIRRL